ncbi:MAG: NPCBM/NEW2 domain-containing protein [Phycisphaerae bacterium]|nr:NPCBM/NEW2 domain-containing protein [Phycisphaerae bacterium]
MKRLTWFGLAWVVLAAPAMCLAEGSPVKAARSGNVVLLDNGLVAVRYNTAAGRFTASAEGVAFGREGELTRSGGKSRIVDVGGALGGGKAIEIEHADGSVDQILLYPGVPFACIKPHPRNAGQEALTMDKLTPAKIGVELGRRAADVRVLGCDGLTPGDKARTSYMFLAAADPKTRGGIVVGWLTHDRGSGIVSSGASQGGLRIEARIEYGKLRIAPGQTADGELLAIGYFKDALVGLETYAETIARANGIRLPKAIPSGYCTWYSSPFGGASDARHMAQLAEFCREHLTKFGFGVLQIDDGWQISGRDFTMYRKDGPYREGMKPTADKIAAAGMTAGIWFIPFGWDHKREIFKEHQDWFVHHADGKPYEVYWAGTCLDMTRPEARTFLRGVIGQMTREWGYKYIKIDGLWTGMAVKILYPEPTYRDDRLGDAVFHDPNVTNVQAYRSGLELVREAAGDDVFILGCNIAQNMRTLGASIGRVDGMRVGRDIGAAWEHILPSAEMGSRLYFLHGRVWYNDPDCLMVREPMTLDQARAWGSWISLTGQLNLVSEWLPALPAERLEIVKRSMPNHGLCGRPVDLFESALPKVWHLRAGEGASRRDVVGVFNWDLKKVETLGIDAGKLGLPEADGGAYVGFDYWAGKFVPPFADGAEVSVPPGSCRVIAIRPMGDRPVLVSTSRHITQGVVDIAREAWDGDRHVLSGTSRVVGGDPYELRIAAPIGSRSWEAVSAKVSEADKGAGVSATMIDHGPGVRVRLDSKQNRQVDWAVHFKPGEAGTPEAAGIGNLRADAPSPFEPVTVTWDESGSTYRLERSEGSALAIAANRFVDGGVEAGKTYTYTVRAVGWSGQAGEAARVTVTVPKLDMPPVPPRPDVLLSGLKPVRASVGWGKLGTDKSAEGKPLRVSGKKYDRGVGVHANSELVYACRPEYKRFVAVVGPDCEVRSDARTSVVFEVWADGRRLARSPKLAWKTIDYWHFDVAIPPGCREVRLVVTDGGDGISADHADWVEAGFVTRLDAAR